MKRIYSILLTAALLSTAFTACDNDDDEVFAPATSLTILSRETSFQAGAATGTIVVDAKGPVTVEIPAEAEWINATADGNTVTVNVNQNSSLNGRSAMLTILSGEAKAQIAIIQAGIVFDLGGVTSVVNASNNAATYTYDIKSNLPITVSSDVDWIKASLNDGKLTVNVDANTSGHFRYGTVTYKAEDFEGSVPVTQVDYDQDIAGDGYAFAFVDSSTGRISYFDAVLGRTGSSYWIKIPDLNFTIPVTFDPKEVSLTMAAGSYIGDYQGMYIHTVLWDTDEGYLTWSTAASMTAKFNYFDDNTDAYCILEADFEDNGSWGSYVSKALRLEAFSSLPAGSGNRKGSILNMPYPFLQKVHPHAVAPAMLRARSASRSAAPMPKLMPFETGSLSVLKDDSNVKVAY